VADLPHLKDFRINGDKLGASVSHFSMYNALLSQAVHLQRFQILELWFRDEDDVLRFANLVSLRCETLETFAVDKLIFTLELPRWMPFSRRQAACPT
jgi:hypothetical protein